MKTTIAYAGHTFETELINPIDISIPISRHQHGPQAFYLGTPEYQTVEAGGFVGDVKRGGSCNVENVFLSPHGNGTHTECAGHIAAESIFIKDVVSQPFMLAALISVAVTTESDKAYVSAEAVKQAFPDNKLGCKALVIRTLPNDESKLSADYSGSNPPYIHDGTIAYLNTLGIDHILTDLPSLDKEDDNQLLAHHAFFGYPQKWNTSRTATEMIYVPDEVQDGLYWLDLQIISLESDASPSKPLLYKTRLRE